MDHNQRNLLTVALVTLCALTLPCGNGLARVSGKSQPAPQESRSGQRMVENASPLPLAFEENRGQSDPRVKFLARGQGYTSFLTSTEALLVFQDGKKRPRMDVPAGAPAKRRVHQTVSGELDSGLGLHRDLTVVKMTLAGANPAPALTGLEALPGRANYFIGTDPAKWQTNLPTYTKVKAHAVYPGIDIVYYGNQGHLEFDLVVAPGANPRKIHLVFEGARAIRRNARGDLLLKTASGALRVHKPRVYQELQGARIERAASYVLRRPTVNSRRDERFTVGFRVADYDPAAPLIIDPILSYSTYVGGGGIDQGHSIAVDAAGNTYIAGETDSVDLPTANAFQAIPGNGRNAFVAKLNASGSALVYSTYLGGDGDDLAVGIAVDAAGNAHVTGLTSSTDFPTANAQQGLLAGDRDAFVTKIDATGSALIYSTYLGGSAFDIGRGIAVDPGGSAYVTGFTLSNDFPTTGGAFDVTSGGQDAFVAKFDPSGSSLEYSTYLGGTGPELGLAIAADSSGSAFVTGLTGSLDFPTATPFQAVLRGPSDAFVTKINVDGSALVYSTYLGGSGEENTFGGAGIALDPIGNAYVTGTTSSADFPTVNPFQAALAGARDAFVAKLNPSGSTLIYSTYLGGSSLDDGMGIAVDRAGNANVTGFTFSTDFPTVSAVQRAFGGGGIDAFVTKLDAAGSGLVYSTYLGGRFDEGGLSIAVREGSAYVTGRTASNDFPTGARLASFGGAIDAFVTKITTVADLAITKLAIAPNGTLDRYEISVTNNGPDTATGVTVTDSLPEVLGLRSVSSSQGTCSGSANIKCALGSLANGASARITLNVAFTTGGLDLLLRWRRNTATVSATEVDPDLANNSATESTASPPTSTPPTSAGDSGGGGCFIATAAYGSYLDPHVQALRDFRDAYLMTNAPGRTLVGLYETYSPPVASSIARHAGLRWTTRVGLTPVVYAIRYPVPVGASLLVTLVVAGWALRTPRARGRREHDLGGG